MQFLNCSLIHRWAFSNVWGHLRKNKKENNCNRMRMGKEHQKLKQSFICKTFWNVHLPTSWLQILASPFMNKHSPLQSCWSWKASAGAKQGQYTSILPPALTLFLPATNAPALTLWDKLSESSAGVQENSSFLLHLLTLQELLRRFCICCQSQRPPEVLAGLPV